MAAQKHIYGEIDSTSDLKEIFEQIRMEIAKTKNRSQLSELYRRAGYLITLTYSPAWHKKFHGEIDTLRQEAEKEFTTTAKKINQKARELNLDADYDEKWGK